MWGSFEIKNVQLVKQMLQQYYKFGHLNRLSEQELESVRNISLRWASLCHEIIDCLVLQVANDFDALPLQYMNFYGPTDIMKVYS